ncbi:hypothetical protein QBC41DRAFT_376297 [Cercophora samala]|uniref:Nephrocystin 3-like N-terminal domain-containing protein n=1 Tax=Cercophora samala TaxID=330535 RepID=A0AA39Z619_9PEZI|nr:hypothetical protein QBC41DRAFT_376297 [Cercophora samala]
MEALAALGLACNILDNIDRACKYVKKTKEIYDSAMGLSGEVENLVEVVKTMAQVTEEMQKLQPRVLQSTADQAMCEVIGESLQLTKDINALMLSCLPKTEHSWLSAAAATIRSRRKRSELATLEKTLREKFQILNSSVITKTLKEAVTVKQLCGRLDTKLEFSRAQQFSSDKTLCSITTQLEHMERDLTAHYSELRGLVHSMRQTTDDVKIASILQALHFDTIHRRFREVADSEIGTFGWIINDPTRQMKLQDELKVAFPDWLKTGEGVFHIAGKPGSGKSTLMKFICKHKQVDNLLEEWAGPRELLSVKFFFWKVGALEQRSLFGLIQGLLFAVIEKAPTLAKTLFSEVWQPNRSRLAGSSPLNLTDQEITAALEKLTKDRTLLERYRICIFVDGLDEFEPDSRRGTTHASLVRRIQEWTRNAAGGVKWCVSSREEPVFETMFSASQRITIQNFTRPDVEELIRHRFAENEIFAGIRQAHTERFQSVVNTVLEDADGVFLWVVLLLTQFEESVANGDGIDLVEQILKKAPTELESFFQAILDSVPEHYRDGAYTLLAIALRMQGTLLDSPDLVVLDDQSKM